MAELTVERLKEVLDYNPETGEFKWKISPSNNTVIGSVAGSVHSVHGHIYIRVDGKRYLGHRLAWFYSYGVWPKNQIDHKNRVRSENWLGNLREADPAQQRANSGRRRDNSSGVKGVVWHCGAWVARVDAAGRRYNLGRFSTKDAAAEAYARRARELHGEFACDGV